MNTNTRLTKRNLVAAAAATVLMAVSAAAQAGDSNSGISREQVRMELAEARTLGLMDLNGEAGATDRVLAARELHNQTQTRIIVAQMEAQRQREEAQAAAAAEALAAQQLAAAEGVEQDPLIVVVRLNADGAIVDSFTTPLEAVKFDTD